jgi:hypothetical protein
MHTHKSLTTKKVNGRSLTYLSLLTLNVNRLNFPIKINYLAHWIKKEDLTIYCLQVIHLIDRKKHCLKGKEWKKIYQASGPENRQEEQYLYQIKWISNLNWSEETK